MADYELRYFTLGSSEPAVDRQVCSGDAEARARAASGLLLMPHREGVEVWRGDNEIYERRRGQRQDAA